MNPFFIMISFFQIILFLVHYLFYRFGIKHFSFFAKYKKFFALDMILLSVSFPGSMFLLSAYENPFLEFVHYVSAFWLGTVLWLFIALVMSFVFKFFIRNIQIWRYVAISLFVFAFGVSFYGLYNSQRIDIVTKDIYIADLSDSLVGKKAIFMADNHYGSLHTEKKAKRDVSLFESIGSDMVFVAGDFFDRDKVDMDRFVEPYSSYNPPMGKYFISGNHETYSGLERSVSILESAGFKYLDNKVLDIGGVQVLGVPYASSRDGGDDKKVTGDVFLNPEYDQSLPSIVLKHVPINTDQLIRDNVVFSFFGHTHHGQMWPFSVLVKSIYKEFYYGSVVKGGTIFYTTSGIGGWGPPQRIGTDSEILLLTFNKK
jgi:predicted MPP superfamily phosphohydrolase